VKSKLAWHNKKSDTQNNLITNLWDHWRY